MDLSNLRPADGSKQSNNFRRGRGHASGNGKTAGKGHKGQKARSGAPRPGFEGGQMPLYRRIPKRGFKNRNTKEIIAINVSVLEKKFESGDVVAIRKVSDFIEWGKTYVLDTEDGAVIKRLYDEDDSYRCVSYNSEYPDFLISKASVFGVYKVVGMIRI